MDNVEAAKSDMTTAGGCNIRQVGDAWIVPPPSMPCHSVRILSWMSWREPPGIGAWVEVRMGVSDATPIYGFESVCG